MVLAPRNEAANVLTSDAAANPVKRHSTEQRRRILLKRVIASWPNALFALCFRKVLMKSRQTARTLWLDSIAGSAAILLLAITGCGEQDELIRTPVGKPISPVTKVDVFVVNYPLVFLTQRVGGDFVEVNFRVPADVDPAYWEPDVDDVARLQSADLVLLNGADYAKWTLRATLPWSRTVITTRDVEDQYIEVPNAVTHSHGPEGEHSHAGLASETWIDPQLAISQALVVKEELQELLPDSSESIEENFDKLKEELLRVDEEFEAAFAGSTLPWTASCPAFRYLGRRYDLNLQTMNWEPSVLPSDEQWSEFDKRFAGSESSLMLWPEEPLPETLERLGQRGIRVVIFRLVAHRSGSDDYLEAMRQNLSNVEAAISTQLQE